MVHYRTFLAVLSAAAAVSAVPVRRTDHEQSMQNYDSSKGYEQSKSYEPEKSYEKPAESYEKPSESYEKPSESYEKPSESYEKPSESYEKPSESYEKPAEWEQSTVASTSTSMKSEYTPPSSYGSGSWDKSGYNDCVSKCMAQFGGGSSGTYQGSSSGEAAGSAGSVGEGATHTVVVAPSQGVLRYVPPFIDANVGDTIMFKWGANNHTVTKGSALLPCNKTSDALFASGTQSKDFTFTQRVNDTSATYFYCATPGHCQKGMFGVINPSKANGSNSSAGVWMNATYGSSNSSSSNSTASNSTASSNMTSYMSYTSTMTQNNAVAANWGSDFDMSSLPDWAKEEMAGNIMYMRNLIATNPDMINAEGKVAVGDAPLALPNDIGAVNNAASSESASPASPSSAAPSASSTSNEVVGAAQNNQPNGAGALTSSKFAMGAAVIFATMFLL